MSIVSTRADLLIAALLLASIGSAQAADKPAPDKARAVEPLDADFLEYLAELEGSEEDWTFFAEVPPAPRSSVEKEAAAKPAADAKP